MTSENDTGSAFGREIARIAVGGYGDAQEMRTAMMNRVRDIVRKRNEGIPFDETEDEKDPEDRDFEAKYQDENLPDVIDEMREVGTLAGYEHDYLVQMLEIASVAADIEGRYQTVMQITEREPIYEQWLDNVYGVSTTLAAKLIHQFGYCEERETPSQIWSYAGLAPGQEPTRGEQLGYNPEAKTLAWLVADRIIMQGENSRYKTEFYDPYKAGQVQRMEDAWCTYCGESVEDHYLPAGEARPYCTEEKDRQVEPGDFDLPETYPDNATPPANQGHADARARRYLAKKFLKHYWALTREIQGLETPDEWVLAHDDHEKHEDSFENPFYARRALADPHAEAD